MAEFFDDMQALGDKLHHRTRISQSHSCAPNLADDLEKELDELKRYLSAIHARLHNVRVSSMLNGDHRSSGGLSRILTSIHGNLQNTLQLIDAEDRKSLQPGTEVYPWKPETLRSVAESMAIENHKLRVLLCTFDPDENVESAIALSWREWRWQKIERYVETEIQRCGRQSHESRRFNGYNLEFKWNKLNDAKYLSNLSGDGHCDVFSRSWEAFVQWFTRNLQIAQEPSCEPSDRWIHLMICSHYLMSARGSREYLHFSTLFTHPQDSYIIETGFTLHHYVTELEILLFGILTEFETEYLHPDVVQERSKMPLSSPSTPQVPQTPPLVDDRHQSISTGSTQSMGIDEYGVIFRCHLSGEQAGHFLKVRADTEGALFLDFDKETHLWPMLLRPFRNVDLLRASIHPSYPTPDIYKCDIILERKLPKGTDVMTGCLFFQSSTNLKEFQRALTGYNVLVDFKRGIKLRTMERYPPQSKNSINGRLQIWLKDFDKSVDSTQTRGNSSLRRALTSLSTMSVTTFSSMATMKAQQAIPGSHLGTIDEGIGLIIKMPIPPLVIMFVESSSKDKKIQRGQISAFRFDEQSKLDRKKCKADDKFPRCFVLHAVRVDLEIGPMKFPQNPKELGWIEISFPNDEEREIFTKQLEDARKIYNGRMEQYTKGLKFLLKGHHNTKEYSAD